MRRLVLLVSVLAVALAAPAQGDDSPALIELRLFGEPATKAGPGNHVLVVGRALHTCPEPVWEAPRTAPPRPCDHAGVVVKVGGKAMQKLSVEPTGILFALDDVAPGKHRVEVEVDGKRVGSLPLDVLPEAVPSPEEEEAVAEEGVLARFAITMFELRPDADGVRFVVAGRAVGVPDGATMAVTLAYEKRSIEGQLSPIGGGAFRASFGPYSRALPFGEFSATALFELKKQPRRVLRGWTPTEQEAEVLEHLQRTAPLVHGTPEQITAQRDALRAHYRAVAAETERLLDDALAAYASGCRVLFRDPARNAYRPVEHAAHVEQVGAARTPAERAKALADVRFATATGHLKADEYQAWAEGTWLPAWLGSHRVDRAYREATLVPIDPRAARLAEDLHAIVFGTLRQHAQALFTAARLEAPAALVTPPAEVALPPLEGVATGRRPFERHRDEMLGRLPGP